MAEAQSKAPTQGAAEQHPQQAQSQAVYSIQQPGAAQYATVGPYPPYYPYPPPPTDANGHPTDPNAANGGPPGAYMMAFPPPPPGMIYAYTPSQGTRNLFSCNFLHWLTLFVCQGTLQCPLRPECRFQPP